MEAEDRIQGSVGQDLLGHLHRAARRYLADLARLFGPPRAILCDINVEPSQCHPHPVFHGTSSQADIFITVEDEQLALWQLAHECVHLLDPWAPCHEGRTTNVLEEGIATWYQNAQVSRGYESAPEYNHAEALVKPVIAPLASAIKRLRMERNVKIGAIEAESLRRYCPTLTERTANALCRRFGG